MIYEVRYFKTREFVCPCCGEGRTARLLVLYLDLLRAAWGEAVTVNSGWRCEAHNTAVGGSKNSRHKTGCAADVRVRSGARTGVDHATFVALAMRLCRLPDWEVRAYDSFIHIATPRGEEAQIWDGNGITL
ncbi:MAG: hypothetical protein LBQ90_03705 [Synergistaceae bacterium]|jgi:hypothetical protein|nr:hypothetical protein [Synergistaceae bacterium]